MALNKPCCPACKSSEVIPIVYGNMRRAATDLELQGLIYLDSTLSHDAPLWYCKACQKRLPSELGHLWHGSVYAVAHSQALKELFTNYVPLTKSDRKRLAARKSVQQLISAVFGSQASEMRLAFGKTGVNLVACIDEKWRVLPAPPLHVVKNVFSYLRHVSDDGGAKVARPFPIAMLISGKRQEFVITLENNQSDLTIVVLKV